VTDKHRRSCDRWYNKPTAFTSPDASPYVLSLGGDEAWLPFGSNTTSGNNILVTKAYDVMFHRILRLRAIDKGHDKGAVITGQPGTGESP
jgi:subtilase family serine protease